MIQCTPLLLYIDRHCMSKHDFGVSYMRLAWMPERATMSCLYGPTQVNFVVHCTTGLTLNPIIMWFLFRPRSDTLWDTLFRHTMSCLWPAGPLSQCELTFELSVGFLWPTVRSLWAAREAHCEVPVRPLWGACVTTVRCLWPTTDGGLPGQPRWLKSLCWNRMNNDIN